MKYSLVLVICALGCSGALAASPQDPPPTVGRIASVTGAASIASTQSDPGDSVEVNWPAVAGERIRTGVGGQTELAFNAATVRLEEESALTIVELTPTLAHLRLDDGLVAIHVPHRQQRSVVRLEAATSQVELNLPGDYRLRVDPEGITDIAIQAGHAKVRTPALAFHQHAGEHARIAPDGTIELSKDSKKKSASRVFNERGKRSEPHVARNLVGYEELDAHGRWHWEEAYGMVWEPRTTRAGWAPFRFGHWIWKAPWGWTWVDDAPWGFATSHYGRWVKIENRWKWMAGARQIDAVYAPALVGWLRNPRSPELIGWYPLGPGQEYAPPYPASPAHRRGLNALVSVTQADPPPRDTNATSTDIFDSMTWMPRVAFDGHPLPATLDRHVAADPAVMSR